MIALWLFLHSLLSIVSISMELMVSILSTYMFIILRGRVVGSIFESLSKSQVYFIENFFLGSQRYSSGLLHSSFNTFRCRGYISGTICSSFFQVAVFNFNDFAFMHNKLFDTIESMLFSWLFSWILPSHSVGSPLNFVVQFQELGGITEKKKFEFNFMKFKFKILKFKKPKNNIQVSCFYSYIIPGQLEVVSFILLLTTRLHLLVMYEEESTLVEYVFCILLNLFSVLLLVFQGKDFMPVPSLFYIFAFKCLVKSTRLLREGKHSLLFSPFNLNKEETTLFSTALLINNNDDLQ